MKIEDVKEKLCESNLDNWKMVQIDLNRIVLFKIKYKYTDCIYINTNNKGGSFKYERIFDNKYLKLPIERLLICKVNFNKEEDMIKYINQLVI